MKNNIVKAATLDEDVAFVFSTLTSGSGYWLGEYGYDYAESTVSDGNGLRELSVDKYMFTKNGSPLRNVIWEDFPGLTYDFAEKWLSRPDLDRLNTYITQANRYFVGGDFNAWACQLDPAYKDVLLQDILFGELKFS